MHRKPPIFLLALGSAIALHGVAMVSAPQIHLRYSEVAPVRASTWGLATGPFEVTLDSPLPPESQEKQAEQPADPEKAPPPADPIKPPPPEPAVPQKPDVAKFPDRIGEKTGEGVGTHRSEGDKPLLARHGNNDQAFLDRDPRGPGFLPTLPSPSMAPVGNGGKGGEDAPRAELKVQIVPPMAPPVQRRIEQAEKGEYRPGPVDVGVPATENGVETTAKKIDPDAAMSAPLASAQHGAPPQVRSIERSPSAVLMKDDGLLPPPVPARLATSPPPAPLALRAPEAVDPAPMPLDVPMPAVAQARPVPNPGDGAKPGIPVPPAGAAQQSDSESDAFSRLETVVRRDGSLDPQFGRKVKTRRPQIPISGMVDAALGARSVTMKVRINPDGTVANVSVTQSSGSNELDTPCVVSMYDWWFEPLTDRTGKAIPDTIFFTINFR